MMSALKRDLKPKKEIEPMLQTETVQTASRERRFRKVFFNKDGQELQHAELSHIYGIGIQVDDTDTLKLDLEGLQEPVMRRLLLEGIYDKVTRAVHTAKPKPESTEAAIKVMGDTFDKIKEGTFRKPRIGGPGAPKSFDRDRLRNALTAGAKGSNLSINDEKLDRLVEKFANMSGKERQAEITKFMKDPHFKTAWEKPVLDRKKQAIKKGEVVSMFADLGD
jgi:hypothetical protein